MILIVDDNPSIREILEVVLTSANYTVCAAESGEDAMSILAERNDIPELILLDLTMPGMTGYQTLDAIRHTHDPDALIPVVFVSAMPPDEERARALAMGACDYMAKPFRIPELLKCVQTYARKPC